MKDVAISATTLAIALAADAANSILGRVVEPKTRWNLGSLVGAAISDIEQATAIILTPTKLEVYKPANAGVSPSSNEGDFMVDQMLRFSPVNSTGRSRAVLCEEYIAAITDYGVSVNLAVSTPTATYPLGQAIVSVIGIPAAPTFTLQGLIAALVDVLDSQDPAISNWGIIVDQFTGKVYFLGSTDFSAIRATMAPYLFVEFDLSEPGTTVEVAGPVWG